MRYLIVWTRKDKTPQFYNVPATDIEAAILNRANGVFLNQDLTMEQYKCLRRIEHAIGLASDKSDPVKDEDGVPLNFMSWRNKWQNMKIDTPYWVAGQVDWMVCCGYC